MRDAFTKENSIIASIGSYLFHLMQLKRFRIKETSPDSDKRYSKHTYNGGSEENMREILCCTNKC